jgi:hypothetical protein
MTINLTDLANKRAKAAEGLTISDHQIDLSKFTGSEVVFTGVGSRGLVFKNAHDVEIIFREAVIDNSSTGVTLKFDGVTNNIKLNGEGTSKLFGKAGNSASQMIYFLGKWSNVEVCGFESDQRRDNKTGSTVTGANCQFAGVSDTSHSLGDLYIHNMIYRNSGDESNYVNNYSGIGSWAKGKNLRAEHCYSYGSGRDPYQVQGFENVLYRNCYAENAGKEADSNHWSGFSINGGIKTLLIEDCGIVNVAQLIYGGTEGTTIKAMLKNVKYVQGTHAGSRSNSSLYLKGPGQWTLNKCQIEAPNVKAAAITADGCQVILMEPNVIEAPDVDRLFNAGTVSKVIPNPTIVQEPITINHEITTDYLGNSTERYLLPSGQELVPKP